MTIAQSADQLVRENALQVKLPQDANPELTQIIEDHNTEVAELVKEAETEVLDDTAELFKTIETSLMSIHTGAQESVNTAHAAMTDIIAKYPDGTHLDTITQEDQAVLRLNAKTISDANTVLAAVKEIGLQTGLIHFAQTSGITASIAATPGLIAKEFKQLKHFLRRNRLDFNLDNVMALGEKYKTNKNIRNCNVTLYCFLRYLNALHAKGKLVENIIYAKFTAAIVSAGFVAGQPLNLTTAILESIPAK